MMYLFQLFHQLVIDLQWRMSFRLVTAQFCRLSTHTAIPLPCVWIHAAAMTLKLSTPPTNHLNAQPQHHHRDNGQGT